jgi:hypothetical protein
MTISTEQKQYFFVYLTPIGITHVEHKSYGAVPFIYKVMINKMKQIFKTLWGFPENSSQICPYDSR